MRVLIADDGEIIVDIWYMAVMGIFNKHKISYDKNQIYLCKSYGEFNAIKDKNFNLAIIDWFLDGNYTGQDIIDNIICDNILIISGGIKEKQEHQAGIPVLCKPPKSSDIEKFIVERLTQSH